MTYSTSDTERSKLARALTRDIRLLGARSRENVSLSSRSTRSVLLACLFSLIKNDAKLEECGVVRACRTSHALIQSMYRIPMRETSTQNVLTKSGKSSYGEEHVMKQQKEPVCPVEMTLSIVGEDGSCRLCIVCSVEPNASESYGGSSLMPRS